MAGGGGVGIIYRKGQVVRRVAEAEMVNALIEEVRRVLQHTARSTQQTDIDKQEIERTAIHPTSVSSLLG